MSSKSPIVNVNARPKIVPIVLPPSADRSLSGRIVNVSIRGVDHSGWFQSDGEGGWALTRAMERKGYTHLEDRYRDDEHPERWENYERYLKDWQAGRTTRPFPEHLLPKSVLDIQRGVIAAEFDDPWNLPAPGAPTTGSVSEPKGKGK